jgi:hypothetical protein
VVEAPAFDATYLEQGDAELETLKSQKAVKAWLAGMEQLVGSGDDFD